MPLNGDMYRGIEKDDGNLKVKVNDKKAPLGALFWFTRRSALKFEYLKNSFFTFFFLLFTNFIYNRVVNMGLEQKGTQFV